MKKVTSALAFIIIFLLLTNVSHASNSQSFNKKKAYDITPFPLYTKDTFMVEMRDGVHLATDVYLPDEISKSHGSILIRTPYNKDGTNMGDWADAEWPTIVQDMRGRYSSEGIDTIFRNAHTDGPDTLAWIASQEWSNGKIATFGGSALGINQYYMAGENPQNLACQYIQVATPNLHNHAIYQGGQFRKSMIEGWLEGQHSLFVLPELIAHENYTLDYWTNTSLEDNWHDITIPAIHIGGWYDCFTQGTIDGFMGYQYNGGNGAKGNSKLIMGPWTHGAGTHAGELEYPENANPDFPFELFVDMIYKFTENGEYECHYDYNEWPAVSYYVMGDVDDIDAPGNEWRFSDVWPITSTERYWYFHENGGLYISEPTKNDEITYIYDPTNPVPTVGGQNLCLPQGPYDQRSVEMRDDVLAFSSSILDEPYEATGPIKARLYVSSNCPDTDFTVKLCDVYPDGRSMLITDGILRMRNRNGLDHWEFMKSDEVYCIEVSLWSTSYIWNEGHQIRVSISSSNYPRFLANPNTIDPIKGNATYSIAENTLQVGSLYPSCIILPEIEKMPSNPPDKPDIPMGPISGKNFVEYTYQSKSIDPDDDDIYLLFDWGDGTHSGWVGPFESGTLGSVSHSWKKLHENSYEIRVKAKDINDVESDWSDSLIVTMPKNNNLFSLYDFLNSFLGEESSLIQIINRIINGSQ
jgi:uncharacterized protein